MILYNKLRDVLHQATGASGIRRDLNELRLELQESKATLEQARNDITAIKTQLEGTIATVQLVHEEIETVKGMLNIVDLDVPVFLEKGGGIRFIKKRGFPQVRAFVLSMPKSGTYLVAEILKVLGLVGTDVHMSESGFTDYRWEKPDVQNEDYLKLQCALPLDQAIQLIAPGQFAVGHLGYSEYTKKCLMNFRVLVTKREARAALVSHMRFFHRAGHGERHGISWKFAEDGPKRMEAFMELWGSELIIWYKGIVPWVTDESVIVVPFEALYGDYGQEHQLSFLRKIAQHIGVSTSDTQLGEALVSARETRTITRSDHRSDISNYWSSSCEEIFLGAGGGELNRLLGYGIGYSQN